jgi:acetyl esterase
MALDPRIAAALALLPERPDPTGTPAQRRAEAAARGASMAAPPSTPVLHEQDVDAGGVPVRVYRPREGVLPAYVFLHGGGWWLGTLDECDALCRLRAELLGCVMISVDYRLAPEHPFPTPLDDCWAAVQWVFANADQLGIDPARVAIGGGSAGGNLAAAVTLLARDTDLRFVAQVLEIPATDLTLVTCSGSADEFASGYGLSQADLVECVGFYLGDHDAKDPLASPLLGELHDLPPALVTVAECDVVRDDGEAYAAKLEAAGVPVTLRRWEGQVHGSMEVELVVPDVAEAYRQDLVDFLRPRLAPLAT